jgi:hypothetical protein
MGGKDHRHFLGQLLELLHGFEQQRGVDQRRPVQGDDDVVARVHPGALRCACGRDAFAHRDERVDHRVPDVVNLVWITAFPHQVVARFR